MGNELFKHHIFNDAEDAFGIALAVRPEHFAARTMLAVIYYNSGRLSEAKEHAKRAITDMDIHTERYKDVPLPEDIADPDAIESFRLMLQSIAEGVTSD
jgi:tetratricopeptide (TPR) repeat protein